MKMNIIDSVKNTAFSAAVHTALEYLEKNPEENIPKAMRLMDQVLPDGWYEGQRAASDSYTHLAINLLYSSFDLCGTVSAVKIE